MIIRLRVQISLTPSLALDSTFFTEFDDFLITRIGDSAQTYTQFWGLLLNFQFTPVGGCQQQVKEGQHVLWAFDAFNKTHFLKLDGPEKAARGTPVTYTVTDGMNNTPIEGASIGGATTDANGKATISFTRSGEHTLKATRSDSLRSNAVDTIVV